MRRYDSYKDCGQQWLGKIPSHWEIKKIKFLASCNDETLPENYDENEVIKYIEISDVSSNEGIKNYTEYYFKDAPSRARRITQQNDIIVSTVRTYLKAIAKIEQSGFVVSTGFAVLRPQKINKSFLGYAVLTETFVNEVVSKSVGASYPSINALELINIKIVLPFEFEQQAIASYLDKQCENIDKAIAQQQRMIDLLNERKQIIIQQAVTKGLNSNAKMKNSGVEWIGQVPEHWEVMKTSHIYSNIGSGTTPSSSNSMYYTEDTDGFYWLQTGDLNDGQIWNTSKKVTKLAVKECKLKFYPVNSVVIAMYGATIGKVGLLKIETATNQACCVLPKSKKMKELFSFYLYQAAKQPMILEAMGGGQPNISQDIIKRLKVPVPPLSEQQQIVDHIEKQITCINKAIAKQQQTIELLKERKQIIINEAVTGKIKVI